MRMMSWNMGCSYGHAYKRSQPRTWDQLTAWAPDLALVQETLRPPGIDPDHYVFTPYDYCRGKPDEIGTLVYAPAYPLKRADLGGRFADLLGGQVTAADVVIDDKPYLVCSIHAETGEAAPDLLADRDLEGVGASHTEKIYRVDLILDTVASATQARRRFLVGGDLNVSIRFDDLYTKSSPYYGNTDWFGRARDRGWWNAHRKFHTGDQRTLFRPSHPNELFQIDHLFSDRTTWDALTRCDVLDVPLLEELTDHAPLLLEATLS